MTLAVVLALGAALVAASVALKRADDRAARWADITHEGDDA